MSIEDFDDSKMTLSYSGFGRDISITLNGEEADYLPKVMVAFAEFCRAAGFVWVSVDQVDGESKNGYTTKNYLFSGNYKWDDDKEWHVVKPFYDMWSPDGVEDDDDEEDEEQQEINKAASDYWDNLIDKGGFAVKPGDTVYYHGRGEPETTLNQNEEPQGHGGHTGVTLINMRGEVIKVEDTPVGVRALVKWENWNDGHNGMGGDPDARLGDRNYWWSNINNIVVSN